MNSPWALRIPPCTRPANALTNTAIPTRKVAMDDCFRKEKEMRRDANSRKFRDGGYDKGWEEEIERNPELKKLVEKIENK